MNPIIPAIALKTLTEFGARVAMNIYIHWHRGESHERAERYKAKLAEIDRAKLAKELANEK